MKRAPEKLQRPAVCSSEQCRSRRPHREDSDRPGCCFWCGHALERVRFTDGAAPGGTDLAEVVQDLLVFVRDNEATLSVKPAELGRPSAGCIASLVSAGGGAHITSVGGTPELALVELHRMAITEPGHVQAVQTRVPLTPEQLAARVASLSRVCAPREHLEDIDRPGHCLWCGHVIERVKVTTGDAAGTYVWQAVVPVAGT